MKVWSLGRGLLIVLVALGVTSCSGGSAVGSASARLRAAADATSHARSFTLSLSSVEVTYQAPDRVQQVEHGEGSSASGSSEGPSSTSATYPVTITKLFIGRQYFEADSDGGQPAVFSVADRCATDQNAAEYVLRILRAISTSADVTASGDTYAFHIRAKVGTLVPTSGTATIRGRFVRTLSFGPVTAVPEVRAITIGSVNSAPPVTAPATSSPMTYSCGS